MTTDIALPVRVHWRILGMHREDGKQMRRAMVRALLVHVDATDMVEETGKPRWRCAATLGRRLLDGTATIELDGHGKFAVVLATKN